MNADDVLQRAVSGQRRSIGAKSPHAFARVYLPDHFVLPISPLHRELFGLLHSATASRRARIAVAAPRGHAKSTVVSLAYVLWSVLYGHDQFVIIVSATKEQASQLLKHVKDEIESNARILIDFPEVNPNGPNGKPTPWRGSRLQLPNGAMLWSIGLGQQIRGLRHQQHRPSLIVVDDLEMPEHVLSAEQRFKTRDWFEKTLLKVGDDRTNVVLVGTVLHYDSLLAKLVDPQLSPGWTGRKFKALIAEPLQTELWTQWEQIYSGLDVTSGADGPSEALRFFEDHSDAMLQGGEVLWPERESIYDLMRLRLVEGRASFDSEKQNEPLDPEHCLFRPDSFSYWDDDYRDASVLIDAIGHETSIYAAIDPSLGGDPRRGDYSAILIVAKNDNTEQLHVVVADIARRSPNATISRVVEYASIYRIDSIGVEANGFQELFRDSLDDALVAAKHSVYIESITNTSNKQQRIASLQPRIEQGVLKFTTPDTRCSSNNSASFRLAPTTTAQMPWRCAFV